MIFSLISFSKKLMADSRTFQCYRFVIPLHGSYNLMFKIDMVHAWEYNGSQHDDVIRSNPSYLCGAQNDVNFDPVCFLFCLFDASSLQKNFQVPCASLQMSETNNWMLTRSTPASQHEPYRALFHFGFNSRGIIISISETACFSAALIFTERTHEQKLGKFDGHFFRSTTALQTVRTKVSWIFHEI